VKLGIDFGTTRIVVAAVDRGNYPLVHFETPDGVYDEWVPSLVSLRPANGGVHNAERRYGWEAWQGQSEPGWVNLRSIKRYLEHAGPETRLSFHGVQVPVTELLTGLLSSLRSALSAQFGAKEPFEAMLGVPANANTN
jgi:molecular chaperone DnaK (HSP70)